MEQSKKIFIKVDGKTIGEIESFQPSISEYSGNNNFDDLFSSRIKFDKIRISKAFNLKS